MPENPKSFWGDWRKRVRALRNIPPLLRIVWESGRGVVTGGLICRLTSAALPLLMLAVSKRILDSIQAHFNGQPLPSLFWWFVGAEFLLAALAGDAWGEPLVTSTHCWLIGLHATPVFA